MNLYSGTERRRSQRVAYPFEIWYRDRNKSSQGFKHGYGKNISEHGLLFGTYEDFPPCTILEVKIELPTPEVYGGSVMGFDILVEVVHSEEVKHQWLYYIGVSFCKVEDECRSSLKEYILKSLDNLTRSVIPSETR